MPELPEVEVVRLGLEKALLGTLPDLSKNPRIRSRQGPPSSPQKSLQIVAIEFKRKDLRSPMPVGKLKNLLPLTLEGVDRRAKYLLFRTSTETLVSHLGMTGNWILHAAGDAHRVATHDHIVMSFSDGRRLVYNDPRRFGNFQLASSSWWQKLELSQGPEPFDPQLTGDGLFEKFRGKKACVKVSIMDQKLIVGVGNIYASEALFRSQIRPKRRAQSLKRSECQRLLTEIRGVLLESIRAGGSSISDFSHIDQVQGHFQKRFEVYNREGLPCPKCKNPIQLATLGGRSSFWCKSCQY